jgi:hypothetical protein
MGLDESAYSSSSSFACSGGGGGAIGGGHSLSTPSVTYEHVYVLLRGTQLLQLLGLQDGGCERGGVSS